MSTSKIQLVHPLTKEIVATNNHWGAIILVPDDTTTAVVLKIYVAGDSPVNGRHHDGSEVKYEMRKNSDGSEVRYTASKGFNGTRLEFSLSPHIDNIHTNDTNSTLI